MTFKIQIELWVGLCINFTSELVIQALTQNPKSKIRFWILFFRNPKSDFGFQGDHAFQKVLLHSNTRIKIIPQQGTVKLRRNSLVKSQWEEQKNINTWDM